ncbi:hypothetical protein L7F22_055475 [Adiantum nelumboides]|nr:hypothetical protein [Adiantum nelumboides]MCO5601355.1 hypothetical protein [Adiantum nelumboides]
MPHFIKTTMEPDFLGLGLSLPPISWLDVRVFYVRLSCCSLDDAPNTLTLKFGPRPISCTFQINGCKVPSSEEPISTLRMDRVDREPSEATYVGTDRLRTTGALSFEVWLDGQGIERIGAVGTLNKRHKAELVMECRCAISLAACIFLERRVGPMNVSLSIPKFKVYVAGRYCGAPVVLTLR